MDEAHRCTIAGIAGTPRRAWRVAPRLVLAFGVASALAACATYRPLPLEDGSGAASVSALAVPLADMPLPGLAAHAFDPADGLDATEIAMLAVANNPELRLARDDLGIARAQSFAAGLLPDPQLALGADYPRPRTADTSTGFTLGLSADIAALLQRSTRKAAARHTLDQVNLELLWQEWQTVAGARQSFAEVTLLRARRTELEREAAALAPVDRYVEAALRAGNLTYDSASAGLSALADVRAQLADTAVLLHQAEAGLRGLLGLDARAALDLVGTPDVAAPDAVQVEAALANLPLRRPDLLALRAGYAAGEAKLRGAILAQFPALDVGFNRARDTGNIASVGFTIGLTLPLLDRNRGNIAIEAATRQRLRDEYAARVLAARTDVARIDADLGTLAAERAQADAQAARLDAARRAAADAWQRGLLEWPAYLAIRASALAADLHVLDVRARQAQQSVALTALLGNAAPAARAASGPPSSGKVQEP